MSVNITAARRRSRLSITGRHLSADPRRGASGDTRPPGCTRHPEGTGPRSSGDVSVEDLREPFQGNLESLVCPATVVAGILPVLVRDSGLGEMVAEQPVTPVQVVVVVPAGV